ncbi:low-density lipoprotein receptor-related protein 5-like [Amphiura filiformis]|uniref:low-density lipoprotein receptor-related protein 5-like n=1 Tax=Amphiura filiformis TaxID=82378 RepID=UPI003B22373A
MSYIVFVFGAITLGLCAYGQPIGGGSIIQESVLVLFTERDPSTGIPRISSIPADNPTSTTSWHYSYDEPRNWTSLTNDYSDKFVFWTDQSINALYKGYFDIHAETIFSGTSDVVQDIAVDWLAKNLYYTDSTYDWIFMTDYQHDKYKVLVDTGLDKPHGLAVHPLAGYIFWTDWGRSPKIERASLSGENRIVLINTGVYQPNGITVDYGAQRVYWVESDTSGSRLETCDLDGGSRRTVATTSAANGFYYDLAIFQNTVFISDWKNKKIHAINKNDGSAIHTLNLPTEPFGLTLYGPNQLPTGDTPSSCASNPCEHLCIHTPSGYQCLCEDQNTLQSDGRTCVRNNEYAVGRVYFVSSDSICSHFANFIEVVETPENNKTCIVRDRDLAVSLAFDVRGRMVFYSDYLKSKVYSVRMVSSSPILTIVGGVGSVEGLAVDWLNQNLYWTDYVNGHICVSRYDGRYRQILISDQVLSPRSLVIHAGQRLMFWSELDATSGQIEKAGLDGGNRQVIAANIGSVNGLAIDFELNRLFYADRATASIYSVDFNGNGRTTVHTRPGAEFFDIAIHRDYLLWTEWGENDPDNRGIRAINRETGEFVKHVPSDTNLYDIDVYDPVRQPDGVAVCGANNGGCAHLCLPRSSGSYGCACATGYELGLDGRTCGTNERTDNFLLMTDSYLRTIFQVDLTNPDLPYTALPIGDLDGPFAITYDSVQNKVYWSDIAKQTINRVNLDGSEHEVLLAAYNGIQSPEGLAIEPIARLLFWTDFDRDTISVSRLDGSYKKTLITTGLDKPRGILLDHRNGILVWSDYGLTPKIERSSLDGSNRRTILSGADVAAPNGIALDYTTNMIYYCDPFRRAVERIGIDGNNRQELVQLPGGYLPVGIALYQGGMFISDWSVNSLIYATQTGASLSFVGEADFGGIRFLHSYESSTTIIGTNACSSNMGGCSDLCLATSPTGRTCACQDGASLMANNLDCTAPVFGVFLCPDTFSNGRVESDCDRRPGSTCAVECNSNYQSEVEYVTCGIFGAWDLAIPFSTLCTEINLCSGIPGPCLNGGTCTNYYTYYTCACVPGWEGLTCNINFNECGSFPCQNGGSCEDGINGYMCSCSVGFSGINCEIGSNPCSSSPCMNGATCVSGGNSYTCNCALGFAGTVCEQDINECASNPCLNGATCNDGIGRYECSCLDGFSGTQCGVVTNFCSSNPCWNGATCNTVTNGYTCTCVLGFIGVNCETNIPECNSNPCINGGICVDLVNGFSCMCQSGYEGDHCQTELDECFSFPCSNGATCINFVNGFLCLCVEGYYGRNCEADINECASNPCLNGATCNDGIGRYDCSCLDGFSGTQCTLDINECASNPCLNSGICIDQVNRYLCSCTNGYSGDRCETYTSDCEPNPCYNGGVCTDFAGSFQCSCSQEWTGNLCEISTNVCSSTPCSNAGTCIGDSSSFTCNCLSGFAGLRCEMNENECLSNPCQYGGTCTDGINGYVCFCQDGTSGVNCQINNDDCSGFPCGPHGICTDLVNSRRCTCQPGFTGGSCEIDVNECSSSPCANGGTCLDLTNSYSCSCMAGYTGTHCQTRVTCPGLPSPSNGRVTPSSCLSTSYYGDSCVFSCNEGDYVRSGPQVQTCTVSGIWSQQGITTSCVFRDTTPPVFTKSCPVEITVTVGMNLLCEIELVKVIKSKGW